MNEKLTKIANRILIFSILILLVDIFNQNLIADFYSAFVYVLGLSGIIISVLLRYLIKIDFKYLKDLFEIIDTVSVVWSFFFFFYLVVSFILYPAKVNGDSMIPNYRDRDIIVVWHLNHQIERFDVVLVNVTDERHFYNHDEYFLKRIIGLPGEHVEFVDDQLFINGELINQPFNTNTYTDDFTLGEVCRIKGLSNACSDGVIPEDYYFVLGDNRDNSTDSRIIGLVHESDIFGKSIFNFSLKR